MAKDKKKGVILIKKLDELAHNESFQNEYQSVKTPDELVALFSRYGVEMPLEIAQELFESNVADEELPEAALDQVAGGGGFWGTTLTGVFWGTGYIGGRLAGRDKKKSRSYANSCSKVGSFLGGALDAATGV